MVTPHISIRVEKDSLARWQENCQLSNTNVSTCIRVLMDAWCEYQENLAMDAELMAVDVEGIKKQYGI